MKTVLDTSVIAKWFKEEGDSSEALELREAYLEGRIEIAIPDLVFYEISNVMRYDDSFDTATVKESVETLRDMEFEVVAPYTDLINKAIELADKYEITVYDASFLALARLIDATLITTDQELYNKTQATGNTQKLQKATRKLQDKQEK